MGVDVVRANRLAQLQRLPFHVIYRDGQYIAHAAVSGGIFEVAISDYVRHSDDETDFVSKVLARLWAQVRERAYIRVNELQSAGLKARFDELNFELIVNGVPYLAFSYDTQSIIIDAKVKA